MHGEVVGLWVSLKYCLVHGSGDGDDYDEEVFGLSIIRLASK